LIEGAGTPNLPFERLRAIYGGDQAMRRLLTRWWFWIVISPVLVIAVYAALVLVFVLGKPTISRNFSKELNEHSLAIPESERADKVYRKAAAAFPDMPEDLLAQDSRWPELEPDDPKWDAAREYAKESARGLTLLRQAAAMPNLGLVVSNVPVVDYNLGPSRRVLEQELPPPEENPSLIDLALPHLGSFRGMERVLAFDARLALLDRDSSRASADYAATPRKRRSCSRGSSPRRMPRWLADRSFKVFRIRTPRSPTSSSLYWTACSPRFQSTPIFRSPLGANAIPLKTFYSGYTPMMGTAMGICAIPARKECANSSPGQA
jgi:hypothetical protein